MAPKSWGSRDFSVMAESRPVADIAVHWWREKAVLTIEGRRYLAYREGWVSGAYLLQSGEFGGTVLARAERPGTLRRKLLIHYEGREYTLRPTSAFRRDFVLLDGSRQIGALTPKNRYTRRAAVDLPDAWPPPLRVFTIWLVTNVWRLDSSGAA